MLLVLQRKPKTLSLSKKPVSIPSCHPSIGMKLRIEIRFVACATNLFHFRLKQSPVSLTVSRHGLYRDKLIE